MDRAAKTTRLFEACQVLFGRDVDVSVDFLRYLQMEGLKAAYRRRALDTHPDRAVALAEAPPVLAERFREVHEAYRELHDFLSWPPTHRAAWVAVRQAAGRGTAAAPPWGGGEGARGFPSGEAAGYRQVLPKRALLFGQYAYYSGAVSYRELIDALVWQRLQRPLLGRIGLRWKWLHEEDIRAILRERQRGERFGEAALRGGYLTPERLRTMLCRQRMLQPRIGQYFVEKGIMTAPCVEALVERFRRYNQQFRGR